MAESSSAQQNATAALLHGLSTRIDGLENKIEALNERIDVLEHELEEDGVFDKRLRKLEHAIVDG